MRHNKAMLDDPERCYQAAQSKDTRFDGWFFVGVITTGIYCRPSCPSRTPNRENVRFYPSSASAQQVGLRACRRCRPDATPGSPQWNVRGDVVARAMRLIQDGIIDREGVTGLARHLGYSERQLNRRMTAELGVGPIALARAQRGQTARTLLETTTLPIADVAFAAGFSSVRQYNDTIRHIFADTPSGLRRRAPSIQVQHANEQSMHAMQWIRLRLPVRQPFQLASVLQFLSVRSLTGIEVAESNSYTRSIRLVHGYGIIRLTPSTNSAIADTFVHADLQLTDLRDLAVAVERSRQLLDLDADPVAIYGALYRDPLIGSAVTKNPGLRVPGSVEGFELVVRAIIGQQVSVQGARTIANRIILAAGEKLSQTEGKITHLFPTPSAVRELIDSHPEIFTMPSRRRLALAAVAKAVEDGTVLLDTGVDRSELRQSLEAIPGIGRWTSEYVAMRALRDPDAFMPTDLGLIRAVTRLGMPIDSKRLAVVADRWRPWRSYAMIHLWSIPTVATPLPTSKT